MPINMPHVNTKIDTPLPNNPYREAMLKALLMGTDSGLKAGVEQQQAEQSRSALEQFIKGHPGMGYKDPMGATATPKDTTAISIRHQDAEERNRRLAINSMKKDYGDLVGKSPQRVIAAQAILNALESNDATSQGRIKAQLPLLEGENYKPTDTERELILQTTGEGTMNKLKNYFGGNSPVMSDAQKLALRKYVGERLTDEQGIVDRAKGEIHSRYGHSVKSLNPEEFSEVYGSLGQSSMNLKNQLAQKAPLNAPGASVMPSEPAAAPAPLSFEEWRKTRPSKR